MFKESTRIQDISSPVTPENHSRMPWRVVNVNPLDGFRFFVRFLDGTTGIVDLSGLIGSPHAGVFARLADPAVFAQVFVVHGAVTWPGELDLAPDAMYGEIKKNGTWVLK